MDDVYEIHENSNAADLDAKTFMHLCEPRSLREGELRVPVRVKVSRIHFEIALPFTGLCRAGRNA